MKKYIAMNRFKISLEREDDFEDIWRTRETHLEGVKGFRQFNLIKGSSNDDYTLYASHSACESKVESENWKKSKAFRAAHNSGGQHQEIYLGHPEFEGFEVVL